MGQQDIVVLEDPLDFTIKCLEWKLLIKWWKSVTFNASDEVKLGFVLLHNNMDAQTLCNFFALSAYMSVLTIP